MADYTFAGRVLPADSDVSVGEPIIIGAQEITTHCVFEATISIQHSQVSVDINVKTGSIDALTLRNSVRNLVRTVIDSIGFVHRMALDLELNTVIDSDGNRTVYDTSIRLPVSLDTQLSDVELMGLALDHRVLQRALADFREAVITPVDTGFFCFRAIESLLFRFLEPGETWEKHRSKAWERLRSALVVDREFIDKLEEAGKPQRHGAIFSLTGEDRIELIGRVWLIVQRFAIYVRDGSTDLSPDKYEPLKPRKFPNAQTVVEDFQRNGDAFTGLVLVVKFGDRCEGIPYGFENPLQRLEDMMKRGGRAIGYAGIKVGAGGESKGLVWPITPYELAEVGADLRVVLQHIGQMGGVDFKIKD